MFAKYIDEGFLFASTKGYFKGQNKYFLKFKLVIFCYFEFESQVFQDSSIFKFLNHEIL